jgi:hypothetical protein
MDHHGRAHPSFLARSHTAPPGAPCAAAHSGVPALQSPGLLAPTGHEEGACNTARRPSAHVQLLVTVSLPLVPVLARLTLWGATRGVGRHASPQLSSETVQRRLKTRMVMQPCAHGLPGYVDRQDSVSDALPAG